MKKIVTLLFALLILVGCSSKGYSKLSDGSEVIFTGPNNESFTKNDLYESLKISSVDAVENDILDKIAESEELDLTDVEAEADELVEMYQQLGYETYIIQYYGSIEAFKKYYMSSGILTLLTNLYVEENYEIFKADDKPVKMKMANFETEEIANKVIEEVNNGSTFEMACANNGYTNEVSEAIYLDSDSDLDYNIKEYLNSTDTTGLSTVIEGSASNTNEDLHIYYVLDITDRDVDNFKDEYITEKVADCDSDDVKNYMFKKHDIEFYDQDIYELMKSEYEVFE
jgi:hypothetical protein